MSKIEPVVGVLEEGQALLERNEAYAMWVNRSGEIFYSPGFEDNIRT